MGTLHTMGSRLAVLQAECRRMEGAGDLASARKGVRGASAALSSAGDPETPAGPSRSQPASTLPAAAPAMRPPARSHHCWGRCWRSVMRC
jgi:hypothetical protein